MSHPFEEIRYRVRMETRQWLVIDATLDNEVSVEARSGDSRNVVDLGSSIRQAGWNQIPGWPNEVEGFEHWPAPGQTSTMTLNRAQWDIVVLTLDRWAAVSDSLEDPGSAADAEQSRSIAALIRAQLFAQRWSPR
ncbi:hypothetical protein [Actinomadura harenae]|uniref:Uncharacterized protein n=1 Tax=Actinomadura harenae TaxID=2483351 RepID=A0A3M2M115_9ACTN|nr:hypothetical protein [Actinomadura harenae]RMI43317.1 hypothetical protein EBO15_16690 [Actinomadura harenae]